MKKWFTIVVCVVGSCTGSAGPLMILNSDTVKRNWYIPNYIPVQFAGNIGFISSGAGYSLALAKINIAFMYGYVPAAVSKRTIHLITIRGSVDLFKIDIQDNPLIAYAGISPTLETGSNSYLRMPSRFPKGYYHSNALHLSVYVGLKRKIWKTQCAHIGKGVEFFLEGGTQDVFLYYKMVERSVRLDRIFNLAIGANLLLK